MVKRTIPTMNVLVAGDPCTGKINFINRFLYYYPPSAESRREHDTIHFMYKPDKDFKIRLHDGRSIKTIERQLCNNMDVIFFCYAANDPKSVQNLEKWVQLMTVLEKEVHSFLVADMSDVGGQRDVSEFLAKQAWKLKESFDIKWFIEASFDEEDSSATAFQTILNKVSPPKQNEEFPLGDFSNGDHEISHETCLKTARSFVPELYLEKYHLGLSEFQI